MNTVYLNDKKILLVKLDDATDEESVLKNHDDKYILMYYEKMQEIHLIFNSRSARIRALEFMDFLISDFGLINGTGIRATGVISKAYIKTKMEDMDIDDIFEYLNRMCYEYCYECDWIVAGEYATLYEDKIRSMPVYYKKKIPWAVVKPASILEIGEEFSIKSLENESGESHIVSEDEYIMIGCKGEVYSIAKERFEATYDISDEKLDFFEQMMDMIPEIKNLSNNTYMSIDEVANLCYPKKGSGIYVRKLDVRTKVYGKTAEGEYFIGRKGDYIATRCDDIADMYIIRADIFEKTYQL